MGEIFASCGHKIKNTEWSISISDHDKRCNPAVIHMSVCPNCYHGLYKERKTTLTAEKSKISEW